MGRNYKCSPLEAEAELGVLEVKRSHSRLSRSEEVQFRKLQKLVSQYKQSQAAFTPKRVNYSLGDFQPKGSQVEIAQLIDNVGRVIVQGSTGTGKTSLSVWKALTLLNGSKYKKIIFVKNPTEVGDDPIGFLKGSEQDKLQTHFEAMRGVFLKFMSPEKLASDEAKGVIKFTIPNFELGTTYPDDTIIIMDEVQTWSPATLKLIIERASDDSKVIILGDRAQTYSIKKRVDGLTDLVLKVTKVVSEDGELKRISSSPFIGFVQMSADENRRGKWSQYVTQIYAVEDLN